MRLEIVCCVLTGAVLAACKKDAEPRPPNRPSEAGAETSGAGAEAAPASPPPYYLLIRPGETEPGSLELHRPNAEPRVIAASVVAAVLDHRMGLLFFAHNGHTMALDLRNPYGKPVVASETTGSDFAFVYPDGTSANAGQGSNDVVIEEGGNSGVSSAGESPPGVAQKKFYASLKGRAPTPLERKVPQAEEVPFGKTGWKLFVRDSECYLRDPGGRKVSVWAPSEELKEVADDAPEEEFARAQERGTCGETVSLDPSETWWASGAKVCSIAGCRELPGEFVGFAPASPTLRLFALDEGDDEP